MPKVLERPRKTEPETPLPSPLYGDDMLRKYAIEFFGTFVLTLTVFISGDPLAIGAVLGALVYMGGPLSGAHYNPAVSAAVTLRGKMGPEMIFYMLVQTAAALAGSLTVFLLEGEFIGVIMAPGMGSVMRTLFTETLLTFVLCFVILNVATSKATEGNQYFGLAIGGTLAAIAHIGMCFNPAIAIGSAIVDLFLGGQAIKSLWVFIVGPMMGGALAAFAYALINPSEIGPSS